jgi:hypothetical protein
MENTQETLVTINKVTIGSSALKKSQIEQMPFITEDEWRTSVINDDNDLSVFCRFPFSALVDVITKQNKKQCQDFNISIPEISSHINNSWYDNIGVILYSSSNKVFLYSTFQQDKSDDNCTYYSDDIIELKSQLSIIIKFLNDPIEDNAKYLLQDSDIFTAINNYFDNHKGNIISSWDLFDFKHEELTEEHKWCVYLDEFDSEENIQKIKDKQQKANNYDFQHLFSEMRKGIISDLKVSFEEKIKNAYERQQILTNKSDFADKLINESPYLAFV